MFCACSSVISDEVTPFEQLYKSASLQDIKSDSQVIIMSPRITFSAFNMPLSDFARIISDKFEIGLVFSDDVAKRTFSAEIKNATLEDVFSVLTRQLSVQSITVGNIIYVGKLNPEDRALLIRKVYGFSQEETQKLLVSILTPQGRCTVSPDGVAVISDFHNVLSRVNEALDYFDKVDNTTWILQIYLVSLRKNNMIQGGLNTKSAGKISYDLANSKINFDDLKFESSLNFDNSQNYMDVFSSPMYLVREGFKATWQDGLTVPVPKKTISDGGTVTTTGFENIDCGFLLSSEIRQAKNKTVNVDLSITISEITSYVEYAPVVNKTSLTTNINLMPEKMYLLGEMNVLKDGRKFTDIFNLGKDLQRSNIQIWGKVYKIKGGDLLKTYPVFKTEEK